VRITRLVLHGFMSHEDTDLDFGSIDATVVVGDNGSGKSALLDAITWALYDRITRPDIDTQDALILDGRDDVRVEVGFTSAGHQVEVVREKQRGRTGSLSVTVDGAPRTAHKQAETFDVIARLVGLPYEGLMAGPIMAQEASGAFMKARPAQRKDLLAGLLGLDRYSGLAAAARSRSGAAASDAKAATALAESMRPKLDAEPEHRLALAAATDRMYAAMEAQSLASARKDEATAAMAAAKAALADMERAASEVTFLTSSLARYDQTMSREQGRLAAALATLTGPAPSPDVPPEVPEDLIRRARQAWEDANEAQRRHGPLAAEAEALTARIAEMQAARARVANVPCGGEGEYAACQFLVTVPSEDAVRKAMDLRATRVDEAAVLRVKGERAGERRMALDELVERRSSALAAKAAAITILDSHAVRLAEADQARSDSEAAIVGLRSSMGETTAALERARAGVGDIEQVRRTLAQHRTDAEEAAGAHTAAVEARQDAERRMAQAEAALAAVAALRAEVDGLDAKARTASGDAATYDLLATAFGRDGIPSQILAAAIPAIESEANRILTLLPGDLSLTLRTERTLRTGAQADTLDVVVATSGWERQYGMLSVGQRFRVDLALRVGLARVLAGRSGAAVDTLWLDEPLAALDADGREAVMETLGSLEGEFGLLVVVSHHPDFNDRFSSRIDVDRVDGISTAVIA
jgi:exonuclease SbcC